MSEQKESLPTQDQKPYNRESQKIIACKLKAIRKKKIPSVSELASLKHPSRYSDQRMVVATEHDIEEAKKWSLHYDC